MKYLKFFFKQIIKAIKVIFITFKSLFIYLSIYLFAYLLTFWSAGFSFYGVSLNPNDYCNLTDIDYTAVLHDDPNGNANVEITEYLTFDVHAASKSNTYKELWRELPEDYVDGVRVTYDVKSVTQILPNGEEIYYLETPEMYWEDYDYTQSSTYRWHHSKGSRKLSR